VDIAVGNKYSLMRRRTKFEYFFICPNLTNLVGKFHVINSVTVLAVPESKFVSPKKSLPEILVMFMEDVISKNSLIILFILRLFALA